MADLPRPREDALSSDWLKYIAEAMEQRAMCLSCVHYEQGCPKEADAERPCCSHEHRDSLTAENMTDELKELERVTECVKDLETFLANSEDETCLWHEPSGEFWESSCKYSFTLLDGTPTDNGMVYCPKCGGKILTETTNGEANV